MTSIFGQYSNTFHFNKMCLAVNYAEIQLLQVTDVNDITGEKIIQAKSNWKGEEINSQACSRPLLLFTPTSPTTQSWCGSLAWEDCVVFPCRRALLHGWADCLCPLSLGNTRYSSIGLCGKVILKISRKQSLFQNFSKWRCFWRFESFMHSPSFAPRAELI